MLVVNKDDKDGGDSCFNSCHLAYVSGKLIYARKILNHLHVGCDYYCRNPNGTWTGDIDRLSTDQAQPLCIIMAVIPDNSRLKRFMWRHLKRLGFLFNTRRNGTTPQNHGTPYGNKIRDFTWKLPGWCGIEFFGIYIRAFNAWYFYHVLLFCDLKTLIDQIWLRYLAKDEDDITNHLQYLFITTNGLPTPFGWLARKLVDKEDFAKRLQSYWHKDQKAYFIGDLYIELLGEL